MASIYDIVTASEIAAYWNENAQYLEPYYAESKFPHKKQDGIELAWLKGAKNTPVTLSYSAFEADVLPLKHGEVTRLASEMPFFKNEKRIDEKTRQKMMLLLAANSPALNTVIAQVFDDEASLMRNAALTREMMRMQLLTTGVIALKENGQEFSYDYGVPASHKVQPTVKWNTSTADPVADIDAWKQLIEDETGESPTEMLINGATLAAMAKLDSIKNGYFANSQKTSIPTADQVIDYLQDQLDITVIKYNKKYTTNGVSKKFVPDGTVTLMPDGPLGYTWFGTTPEEADLASDSDVQVSIVDTGVAISTWKEKDPVCVRTKGSQVCLPSFERADEIIIASVF